VDVQMKCFEVNKYHLYRQ